MTETAVGYARCGTYEQDLAAQRLAVAAPGLPRDRLGGPELSTSQHAHLNKLDAGHGQELSELAKLFSVSRPGVYRVAARQQT
jgi:hypothetical protein